MGNILICLMNRLISHYFCAGSLSCSSTVMTVLPLKQYFCYQFVYRTNKICFKSSLWKFVALKVKQHHRSLLVVETFRSISLPTTHCTTDELDQAFPNFSMQRPQLHELIVLNTHVRGPQSKAENAFGPLVATLLCSRVVSVGQELCFCQLG